MYCSRPVTKKAARPLLSKKPPFNLTKFSDQKNSEIKIMKHFYGCHGFRLSLVMMSHAALLTLYQPAVY